MSSTYTPPLTWRAVGKLFMVLALFVLASTLVYAMDHPDSTQSVGIALGAIVFGVVVIIVLVGDKRMVPQNHKRKKIGVWWSEECVAPNWPGEHHSGTRWRR